MADAFCVHLLVASYDDPNPARAAEFCQCLEANCELDAIHEIHCFIEDDHFAFQDLAWDDHKLRLLDWGRRVTYNDLFYYADCELEGEICVIANSDIFFDSSLLELEGYDLTNKLLCLSRRNEQTEPVRIGQFDVSGHDAWIFRSPIVRFRCNWHLGKWGCDLRLSHEAGEAGLILENPALSIFANHLHASGVRRYSAQDPVAGPMRGVSAHRLGEQPSVEAPVDRHDPRQYVRPWVAVKGGKQYV
jgi:hypothetical protein